MTTRTERMAEVAKLGPTPDERAIAAKFSADMRCNCDLDNWQPERSTGHSFVCRIHKAVKAALRGGRSARDDPAGWSFPGT